MTTANNNLTSLTIDLDAVAYNYLFMKRRLATGADAAAVVKADAYGLGAGPVSAELFRQGCRHFFVARAEEGFLVEDALPVKDAPGLDRAVYVLDGPRGTDMDAMAQSGLVPVLNTRADLEDWAALSGRLRRKLPAILHLDTGMNRLGLDARDIGWLAEAGSLLDQIDIRYVMSHLACADTPDSDMNRLQLSRLGQYLQKIGRAFRVSFANSAGILLGQDYHFDLARPGCALYGINPLSNGQKNPLQPVVHFESRILQLRDLMAGSSVGYGATYKTDGAKRSATLAIGYADGFRRAMQGAGGVHIHGIFCPVMGRVSMDTVVVDISAVEKEVRVGDAAEIIGKRQTVDDLARFEGTIGYEILTGIGKRIKRTYLKNNDA